MYIHVFSVFIGGFIGGCGTYGKCFLGKSGWLSQVPSLTHKVEMLGELKNANVTTIAAIVQDAQFLDEVPPPIVSMIKQLASNFWHSLPASRLMELVAVLEFHCCLFVISEAELFWSKKDSKKDKKRLRVVECHSRSGIRCLFCLIAGPWSWDQSTMVSVAGCARLVIFVWRWGRRRGWSFGAFEFNYSVHRWGVSRHESCCSPRFSTFQDFKLVLMPWWTMMLSKLSYVQ